MRDGGLARIGAVVGEPDTADRPCGARAVASLAPRAGRAAWDGEAVKAEIGQAYRVMARVGGPVGPERVRSSMPQPVHGWLGYDAESSDAPPRSGAPSAGEIRRAEAAVDWPMLIAEPRDRRIVVGICLGFSLRRIAADDGRSHEMVRRVARRGLRRIASELNKM